MEHVRPKSVFVSTPTQYISLRDCSSSTSLAITRAAFIRNANIIFLLALMLFGQASFGDESDSPWFWTSIFSSYSKQTGSDIFSKTFPVSPKIQLELERLRKEGKLTSSNEKLIHEKVTAVATHLGMPPALLWCLFFQESRLNHLEGIEKNSGVAGLGQFSHYSFYEVNHQLDKFTNDNHSMMVDILGSDYRPIGRSNDNLAHPSSYFYIPTAVAASAAYLNNRYHHLKKLLTKRGITFDSQILWIHAAMAYNKGSRSVLSIWNQLKAFGGKRAIEKSLSDKSHAISAALDLGLLVRSLSRIWSENRAKNYAKELKIHIQNLSQCALPTVSEPAKDKTQ